jgi:hypothetical protein
VQRATLSGPLFTIEAANRVGRAREKEGRVGQST